MSSNLIYPAVFCLSLIPAINSIPSLVKQSELVLFPVVSNFTFEIVNRGVDFVSIIPIGEKNRDCELAKIDSDGRPMAPFNGYSSHNGVSMESALSFENDPTPNNSRPKGKQSFGIWKFDLKDQPNADEVYITAQHDCGFWKLTTKIGPFNIGNDNE